MSFIQLFYLPFDTVFGLFTDTEHLGAANGADALGGRTTILHGDGLGALHLPLGAALYTITLHGTPPLVSLDARIDHS